MSPWWSQTPFLFPCHPARAATHSLGVVGRIFVPCFCGTDRFVGLIPLSG